VSTKKVRKKYDQNKHFAGYLRAPEGAERVWCIEYGKVSKRLNDWPKEERHGQHSTVVPSFRALVYMSAFVL
jgi:hypothetical protein